MEYFTLKKKWNIVPKGIIHVGAHLGEELETYFKDTDVRDIVFFEASLSTYNNLKRYLDTAPKPSHLNSLNAFPVGLGAEEKEVEFHVASNGQSSSILAPKIHSIQYPGITFNQVEKISIKTLDSFNLTGYNYLHMDVQGYELEVLRGATNTLKEVKYIYTEVNSALLYENCVLVEDLDKFLANLGFKREDTDWGSQLTWGDALYIKE